MPRTALAAAVLAAVLAASAAGAEPAAGPAAEPTADTLKDEGQYIDHLLAMDDTAAAHVALARWCEARGMHDRARVHWREALVRDDNQPEARAALGFVRRGLEWVPAETARPAPLPVETDPTLPARRLELEREIRDVANDLLGADDPDKIRQGRLRIMMVRDPAAAEPIMRVLGIGPIEWRVLAAEVLVQIPGDDALRFLLGLALADTSDAVHDAAVESLRLRDDHRVVQPLIYACARGLEATMRRAAHALAELRAWEAVPALIANLKTVEYHTVLVTELRRPTAVSGLLVPYVMNVRPVVAPGVVAYDPVIGYISPYGFVEYRRPVEVTTEKTEARTVEQPPVLEALKKITGVDHGYDEGAWRRWLTAEERRRAEKERAAAAEARRRAEKEKAAAAPVAPAPAPAADGPASPPRPAVPPPPPSPPPPPAEPTPAAPPPA